jgi:hypothetical protein
MDQVAICIEGAEQSSLIEPHARLNPLQRILGNKKTASIALSCPQNRTARLVAS